MLKQSSNLKNFWDMTWWRNELRTRWHQCVKNLYFADPGRVLSWVWFWRSWNRPPYKSGTGINDYLDPNWIQIRKTLCYQIIGNWTVMRAILCQKFIGKYTRKIINVNLLIPTSLHSIVNVKEKSIWTLFKIKIMLD